MNLRLFSQACGAVTIIAGLLVLSGWGFEVTVLQSLVPGFPAAQPMTAVAMALSGGASCSRGSSGSARAELRSVWRQRSS